MSKTGGQGITPPPPLGEDENASIMETSTTPTVEEIMKKLEKLNAELTKLKKKKTRRMHPQVKMTIPHMKKMSPTKQKRQEKAR